MVLTRRTWFEVLAAGSGTGLLTLLLIGVPTAVIPTPWFGRAVATRPLDVVFLVLTALLAAALGATYALPVACPIRERQVTAGGMLSFFAIGCPVCNKIALLVLGWSGALTYFAPIQPVLGVAAIALLAWTLVNRLRAIRRTLRPVLVSLPAA